MVFGETAVIAPVFRRGLSLSDWLLLAVPALLHLALALAIHLSPDEAHYALYASRLDWSYFDHPPLIGWVQWPFLQAGGGDLPMRIAPMVAWLITALILARLTDALFPDLPRVWGLRPDLLLYCLSLMPNLLGVAWVPDTLLTALSCAVMLVTWRLCRHSGEAERLGLWVVLGVLLGLAGLSKYTAAIFAAGAGAALFWAHGLSFLRQRGFWIALAIAVLFVLPVFAWNAAHDWISFRYQLSRAHGGEHWRLVRSLQFAAVIWLAHGLLLPVCWVLARRHIRIPAHGSSLTPLAFTLLFAAPGLVGLALLAGRGGTLPHWVQPFVVCALPLAAAGLAAWWSRRPRVAGLGLIAQALLCLLAFAVMAAGGWSASASGAAASGDGAQVSRQSPNPIADLHGWDAAARRAAYIARHASIGTLAVVNWSMASRIAWYARPMPVKVVNARADQFDLWFGTLSGAEDALLVQHSGMGHPLPVGGYGFRSCEVVDAMPVERAGRRIATFSFHACRYWMGAAGQAQ